MKDKKKKVLVALSGRQDSAVAAYILNKQGYECIGISMLFNDESLHAKAKSCLDKNIEKYPDKEYLYQLGVDPKRFTREKLNSRCYIEDLNPIKEFCDWLNIPFYAVKAQKLYQEHVMDNIVASRLLGKSHNPCLDCQSLKLRLLIEKAEMLGVDYVATGHYAKLMYQQKTDEYSILASNDVENDQSFQLARLEQKHLAKLILPLSEMRREEVKKISRMIQTEVRESHKDQNPCFVSSRRFALYVEAQVASTLLKTGTVCDYKTEEVYGEHYGIHHFWQGQQKIRLSSEKALDTSLTVSEIQHSTGTIFLSQARELQYRYLSVAHLKIDDSQDLSKPINSYLAFGQGQKVYPCRLFFKNGQTALVELTETYSKLVPLGIPVAFYTRPGVSGRLMASGYVDNCGMFKQGSLTPHPNREDEEDAKIPVLTLNDFDFKF